MVMPADPYGLLGGPQQQMPSAGQDMYGIIAPQIQKGLLDYANQMQRGENPWTTAGKALSAFSKNYMAALANPNTRGMAMGAGLAGVGDTLSESLSPDNKLKGALGMSSVLENLAKLKATTGGGGKGVSEYERLLAQTTEDWYKNPQTDEEKALKAHIDSRLSTFDTEDKGGGDKEYAQLMKMKEDPRYGKDPGYTKDVDARMAKLTDLKQGSTTVTIQNGAAPLDKKNYSAVVKDIIGYDDTTTSVENAIHSLDPSALTYKGGITNWVQDKLARLDMLPDGPAKEAYKKRLDTIGNLDDLGSKIRHELFGSALTASEKESSEKFIPSSNDNPVQAVQKLQRVWAIAKAAKERRSQYIAKGVGLEGTAKDEWMSHADDPEEMYKRLGSYERYISQFQNNLPKFGETYPGDPNAPAKAAPTTAAPSAAAPPAAAPPAAATGMVPPPSAPPVAAPPSAAITNSGISVQGGRMVAPKPKDRAEALDIFRKAKALGVDENAIAAWLKENGLT
jgi:hypothetical protein